MNRSVLVLLAALLLFGPGTAVTQPLNSAHGIAIVIFKYDRSATIWGRTSAVGELQPGPRGELYRSFPTGPKTAYGDERIPEGIYNGRIDASGNVSILFETWPGMPAFDETYRITGASLDRNVIPLRGGFDADVRAAALAMLAAGYRHIPVVILPGRLEPEVAEMLGRARGVRGGQRLEDVEHSIIRWKPVEDYLVTTGRIPILRFEDGGIIIEDPEGVTSPGLANN